MWVGTLEGFYSAVEHENDATKVVVRARDRVHLVELQRYVTTGRIFATKHRDYQYRSVMPKADFGAALAKMVTEGLTYNNYKMAVGERDPHRTHVDLPLPQRSWLTLASQPSADLAVYRSTLLDGWTSCAGTSVPTN